jgi:hypothetical protein
MLKITGDGRKAALDMRLVDPFADAGGRRHQARGAVSGSYAVWDDSRDLRSTQLVFCDLSTPNPDRFNVYDESAPAHRGRRSRRRKSPSSTTPTPTPPR